MTNIIADIAGRYDELILLTEKMPEGPFISLGDMIDRGSQSKEVLDFFMQPGRRAVMGNHEHMMVDCCRKGGYYDYGIWQWNGGRKTLESFDCQRGMQNPIPKEYVNWCASLPLYLEIDNCLISHSFVLHDLESSLELGDRMSWRTDDTIIWNRNIPQRLPEYRLQVVGHNSQFRQVREFGDEAGTFAISLDASSQKVLTGMVLETGEIFQQEYL